MREGAFPHPDEPVDEGGRHKTLALAIRPAPDRVVAAPSLAARQTVEMLGLEAEIEPALADMDWGAWSGKTLTDLHEADPARLMGWIANPAFGAPDGEMFENVRDRVSTWMSGQGAADERILAITHPNIMRAALAHVLDIPHDAAFRIDIPPLARLTLSFNRVWRFQGLSVETSGPGLTA